MTIGETIRKKRKESGLTQIELAQASGIAVNSLRLYEQGKRIPKRATQQKIADALGISPHTFRPTIESAISDEMKLSTINQRRYRLSMADLIEINMAAQKWPITVDLEYLHLLLRQLTPAGQEAALKRIEEIAEIPRYRREEMQTADGSETPPAEE